MGRPLIASHKLRLVWFLAALLVALLLVIGRPAGAAEGGTAVPHGANALPPTLLDAAVPVATIPDQWNGS